MAKSFIQDYRNNQNKKEQNWFEKTTKTAVALVTTFGLTYSFFKMRGPFTKILRNTQDERLKEYFSRSLKSYDNRPVDEIMRDLTSKRLQLSRELNQEFYILLEDKRALVTTQELRMSIDRREIQVISTFKNIISDGSSSLAGSAANMGERQTKMDNEMIHRRIGPDAEVIREIARDSLARVRQQTIIEFLGTGTGIGKANFAQVQQDLSFYTAPGGDYMTGDRITGQEQRQVIDRTTTIHEKLLKDEPEYAALYYKRIGTLARRAQLDPKALPSSLTRNWREYRGWIYGGLAKDVEMDNLVVAPEKLELYSKQNPVDWAMGKSLTSGGKRPWTASNPLINQVGNVEYAPYIKRLVDTLNNAIQEDTGLSDFNLSVSSYDYLENERRYLTIELFHKNKKLPTTVNVPLETNGYVPLRSPSAIRKLGHFYTVASVYGTNPEADQLIRSGQHILTEVTNLFQTSAMKSGLDSFKDNPDSFKKRLYSTINRIIEEHAPETGADRDAVHMFSIWDPSLRKLVNPGQHSSTRMKMGYENFVLNMKHMQHIAKSDKKSVIISIDLESLSNSKAGPEFTVNDFETQFVKAGIAVMNSSDKTVLKGIDLSSTHGLKHFRKAHMSKRLKDWIRSSVLPNGYDVPDEMVDQVYEKYLKSSGAKDFADNKDFLTVVKNQIEDYRRDYTAKGYNVYFVTKNGSLFDLRALEYHLGDPTWIEMIKKKHIDIQATAGVLKKGYSLPGALSAERMLQNLLGDLGEETLASQLTRGHSLPASERKGLAKKLLMALGKNKSNSVGELSKLLNMNNTLVESFEKAGWLEALHASPLLDALGTLGLWSSQYESMKVNPLWRTAAGTIEKYLKSDPGVDTAHNIFGVIQKMMKRTYPGFGVPSASSMSHGALHNQVVSLVDLAHLMGFPDNDLSKQWNQTKGQQWNMKPNMHWFNLNKDPKLSTDVNFRLIYGDWVSTDFITDFRNQTLPKATDAANQYTKSVLMKTVHALDFTGGGQDAGISLATDAGLNKFSLTKTEYIDITDGPNTFDPVLNEKIRLVQKETINMLGGPEQAAKATAEQWEAAGRKASNGTVVTLSEEILGASKYNEIKASKKNIMGKIITVIREPSDQLGSTARTKVALEYSMTGIEAGKLAAQARPTGSKAVLSVVKPHTYGMPAGYEYVGALKALSKNYVGEMKELIFNNVLVTLFRDYHRSDTNSLKKAQIKKAIDFLAHKAHAEYDLDKIYFRFIRKDIGEVDSFTKFLGNVDIQLTDLVEAAKMGGMNWSPKDITEIKANKGKWNAVAYLKDSLDKHLEDIQKRMDSNNGCLEGLDRMTSRKTFLNLKAFSDILLPDEKHAKLITVEPISAPDTKLKYKAFLPSYSFGLNMYGITNVEGNVRTAQRNEYMLVSKIDSGILGATHAKWLNDYVVHRSSQVHRDALSTFQSFRNVLLGEQSLKKPLNLDQLSVLINRDAGLTLESAKNKAHQAKSMSPVEIAELMKSLEDLIATKEEANDIESVKFLKDTYDEIMAATSRNAKEMMSKFRKSPKFFSYQDVLKWQTTARENNGIIAMLISDPAGNNAYKINLKAQIQGLVGIIANDHTMSSNDFNRIYKTMADVLDSAQKNATKPLPYKFDKETGLMEFTNGSIFIPFDENADNNFNKLSVNTYLGTKATKVKAELAESIVALQTATNKRDWTAWKAASHRVDRDYTQMLMLSFGADKNSKLWQSIQMNPPSVWKKHKGIEIVKMQAKELLEQLSNGGGPEKLRNLKGFDVRTTLGKILEADLNTVLISENVLMGVENPRKTMSPKGVSFDGTKVNYFRQLEQSMPDFAAEVKTGQRYLPGGITIRFPQTPSGRHGQLNNKYLAIPNILKEHIGIDDNSFYAHTMWTGLQGNDSDGDIDALHFMEFNTIAEHDKIMKENRESLRRLAADPEILNIVKQKKFEYKNGVLVKTHINEANWVSHWMDDGKAMISSVDLDKQGNLITTPTIVDRSTLDITSFPEAVIKLSTSLAKHSPGYEGAADYLQQEITRSMVPSLTKQLIPASTNLLKKRMSQLYVGAQTGMMPGGQGAFLAHLGTINSGLAGILGQLPIALTKHHDQAGLAESINALKFLGNVDKNDAYRSQFLEFAYKRSKQENWIDALKTPREQFDREMNAQLDLFRAFDVMDRTNPEIGSLDRSSLNAMSGRSNANWWDFMKIKDVSPSFFFDQEGKGLADMVHGYRFKVDFSDATAGSFRKAGKYGAIAAAAVLSLSLFKPISPSNSNSPFGAYLGVGGPEERISLMQSQLELPRGIPLDITDPSFSNEAFIKLNDKRNYKKDQASVINGLLQRSKLIQPYDFYTVPVQPNHNYANYTMSIPYMGTTDLQRRANL